MNDQIDEERAARIRHARQVLAGTDIEPPADLWRFGQPERLFDGRQLGYLVGLAVLLGLGVLLLLVAGMGPASAIFFLLALGLLAGWLIFRP